MKKISVYLMISIIMTLCFNLVSCDDNDGDPSVSVAPTIISFNPSSAPAGAQVVISGTGFSAVTAENIVKFNGEAATITAVSATQLTVNVPAGATSGKISVAVAGQTATSANDFEILKDIPRNGLVAFYPFNGSASDISGNSLNGTVNGAALSADRFGKSNQSYIFDGQDDYIQIGNPSLLQISTNITLAAWVKVNAFKTTSNKFQAILTKIYFDPNNGGNPSRGYTLGQDATGGGTPMFTGSIFSSAGLTLSSYLGETVTTGSWIFIALTIENANYKFYQNNTMTHSGTSGSAILDDGSKGDLTIGKYSGGFFFNGNIDDVAVYNRALTSTEIQQLYEQTISKY